MDEIPGTLNIMNDISRLDGDLLLKAGIQNETQAKFAATSFLEDDRDLHTNDSIVVTGQRVSAGKIRMSDARAGSTHELAASDVGIAIKIEDSRKQKKRGVRTKSKNSDKKELASK
jgi:hypothetical protein